MFCLTKKRSFLKQKMRSILSGPPTLLGLEMICGHDDVTPLGERLRSGAEQGFRFRIWTPFSHLVLRQPVAAAASKTGFPLLQALSG